MFNGAKKYGPGDLDKVMEANGGANNAYTTQNVTVYQDWFPRIGDSLDFRYRGRPHPEFDISIPAKIQSERGVVASERRLSVDNNNGGLLDEQLWATAFIAHPYQWPVVGWMSDIEHWTMEDLKHHFEMGYSPSNATMVVVGDVTPEEIFQICEKTIEPIPSHAPPPPVTTVEPPQLGERRLVVHKQAELPLLMIGYHVPATNNADFYATNILRTILFEGESSRMYQRLVDKDQLALDVSSHRCSRRSIRRWQSSWLSRSRAWIRRSARRRFMKSWREPRARRSPIRNWRKRKISGWWSFTTRCGRSTGAPTRSGRMKCSWAITRNCLMRRRIMAR